MAPDRQSNIWKELSRRLDLLRKLEGEPPPPDSKAATLHQLVVPPSDPTGLIELLETMRTEQVNCALALAKRLPHFESIFAPGLPGRDPERYVAGCRQTEQMIDTGLAWCHANLAHATDFEILSCVAGEVTAFHFRTPEQLQLFRVAIGLDPALGFTKFLEDWDKGSGQREP